MAHCMIHSALRQLIFRENFMDVAATVIDGVLGGRWVENDQYNYLFISFAIGFFFFNVEI